MAKGKVQIDLVAKDEASEKIKKVSGHTVDLKTAFLAVAAAAAAMAAAVTAAVGKMLDDWSSAGDEIAKMAKRTGWEVESLSELAYMAKLSGTSLASVETASKKLARSIVDAGDGLATYTREFERLGLNVDDLMQMGVEDQFWTVAMAIANLDDVTLRTNAAVELFGRSGTDLLPILADGAEGVEELRKRYAELAYQWTGETAAAAEEFRDSFEDVKVAMDNVKFTIVQELAPQITTLVNETILPNIQALSDWAKENENVLGSMVYLVVAAANLAKAIGQIVVNLLKLGEWFGAHRELWDALGTILPGGRAVFWSKEQQEAIFGGVGGGGPGLKPGIAEAYGAQASAVLAGGSINVTINGNVMGDEAMNRAIAQALEPYLGEAQRTTSFPHVNTSGYFGGNSAR